MNKLIRFYNQNRKKIWRIIVIIIFAFALLQLANFYAKKQNEGFKQNIISQNTNAKLTENNENIDTTNTQISNSSTNTKTSSDEQIIKQFVEYCNNQDFDNAYNMLTNDCKEEMFKDVNTFKNIYYNSAFENIHKIATIENWANNTYIVKLAENPLETGKLPTTKEEQVIDYITVVEEEQDNYKLNINKYVGFKKLEKIKEFDNIKISVTGRHTYMDYEEYIVEVTNNSNNNIALDTLESSDGIYLEDAKGVKYNFYNHELADSLISIGRGHSKQIKIKFYSSYVSTKKIKQLVFSNFIKGQDASKVVIEF